MADIKGLTIWGLTTMASNGAGPEVRDDPVHLSEETVDALIAGGSLTYGSLNKLRVMPDRSEWPQRWRSLKTDDGELP